MRQTPRERARERTMADIVRIGRDHLASDGAAALSLRAVARDLGVVSSAVYRYVRNRDELLTLLVVDGYDALGDAVDGAVAALPPEDFRGRFRALGRGVRGWALAEPARYGLLFGAPVPGYRAPAERTTGPGTRVAAELMRILEGAHLAGALADPGNPAGNPGEAPTGLPADFAAIRAEWGTTLGDGALSRGFLVWAALFGAVNFEVFGQYGPSTFSDPGALFEAQLDHLESMAGFRQGLPGQPIQPARALPSPVRAGGRAVPARPRSDPWRR